MKIDRMIGILSLLLQREKVTTPELAEHFEVSKRNILRDINTLLLEINADEDGIIAWFLSCGDKVTVLEPQSIKEKMLQVASAVASKYQEYG